MATSATIWPGSHPIMRSSTHALAAGQVLGAIRRHCTTGHIQVIRGQKHDDQISPSFALLLAKAAGQQCRAAAAETHPHEPRCNAEEAVVKKNSKKAVFFGKPLEKNIGNGARSLLCMRSLHADSFAPLPWQQSHHFPHNFPTPSSLFSSSACHWSLHFQRIYASWSSLDLSMISARKRLLWPRLFFQGFSSAVIPPNPPGGDSAILAKSFVNWFPGHMCSAPRPSPQLFRDSPLGPKRSG
jgi:hypothetical protein